MGLGTDFINYDHSLGDHSWDTNDIQIHFFMLRIMFERVPEHGTDRVRWDRSDSRF